MGAGPVGVTAATLLGQYGVECLVLDRWDGVYPQPRAVHLDDEIYRVLARLGIAEQFAAVSRPTRGLQLIDRNHQVFAVFDRAGDHGRHGHPQANMFDQPELEHLLRTNLKDQTTVSLRGNVEVTDVAQDGQGRVRVDFTDALTGEHESVLATYVLGCDGANSVVRTAIGSTMEDLEFEQRWLVIDVDSTVELDQWEGVHQVCDPDRAATYMRDRGDPLPLGVPPPRRRDRRGLRVHRSPPASHRSLGRGHRVRPARAGARRGVHVPGAAGRPLARPQRLPPRRRRPPDAAVHRTRARRRCPRLHEPQLEDRRGSLRRPAQSVLDTYEIERKPHARALIKLAKLIGASMTQGGRAGDLLRKAIAPRLHWIPGLRDRLLDSETPPLHRSALVEGHRPPKVPQRTAVPERASAGRHPVRRRDPWRVRARDRRTALAPAAGCAGGPRDRSARGGTRLAPVQVARGRQGRGRTGAAGLHGVARRPRRRGALRVGTEVHGCLRTPGWARHSRNRYVAPYLVEPTNE